MDGRSTRRNKAAFLNFADVMWTWPKSKESCSTLRVLVVKICTELSKGNSLKTLRSV